MVPGAFSQESGTRLTDLLQAAHQAENSNNYAAAAAAYRSAVAIEPDVPELWANLGLMQHQGGDYRDALQSFRKAYAMKSSLYVPNLFLGIDLFETGNAQEALPFLLRAAKMNGKDPEPLLFAGRAYSSLGERARAAEELEQAVQLGPQLPQPWFYLGLVDLDRVEEEARALTGDDHGSSWARSLYAESLVKQSRYHEAVDVYQDVAAAPSHPPCVRAELGVAYLLLQDRAHARQQFELASQESPVCSLATLGQARLDMDSGLEAAALKKLDLLWVRDAGYVRISAYVLTQDSPAAVMERFAAVADQESRAGEVPADLARFLQSALGGNNREPDDQSSDDASAGPGNLQGKRSTGAAADYAAGRYRRCEDAAAAGLKTRDPLLLRLLVRCSYLTGDDPVASRAADALPKSPSPSPEVLYWSIKAREQLAIRALGRYEQLEPNSERTHLILGDIYRQRQRYESAEDQYQQALAIQPKDPAALLGMAYACFGNGDPDRALTAAQEALQQTPADPEVNLVIGEILVQRHDFANAEGFLDRSLTARPQMLPHIHALLGRVYAETGKNAQAIAELRLGLSSDTDGTVYYQLAQAYRRAGDNQDAADAMQQVKVIEQRRRQASVIAVQDSPAGDVNSGP